MPVTPAPEPDPLTPDMTTVWRPSGWSAAESVEETTPRPLTLAITLVVVPPREKARIAITFGFAPSLMNLPAPEASSFRPPAPFGSRRYCHLCLFGRTRSTYPAESLRRTPTPTNDFEAAFRVPPAAVVVATMPWSAYWSEESATTEERYQQELPSLTATDIALFPAHFRLHLSPNTFWKAFTSSWPWKV